MPDLATTATAAAEHCATRQERIERLMEALGSISSASHEVSGTRRCLDIVAGGLGALGFELTLLPGADDRAHLEARRAGREDPPAVLLIAHVDAAVSLAAGQGYVLDRGVARAPGVASMKGGVVTLLTVLDALHGLGMLSEFEWRALITSDGAQAAASSRAHVERLASEADLALVFGPTAEGSGLVASRAGAGRFRVHVSGESAGPDGDRSSGRNAILELAHKIPMLDALSSPARGVEINIGVVQGGTRPDVVAGTATLWLEARCQGPTDALWLERQIADVASDRAVAGTITEVSGAVYRPPWPPSAPTEALVEVWRQAGEAVGLSELEAIHAPTATDANLTHAAGVPTLDGLGPLGGGLHTEQEWADVAGLGARAAMTAAALVEWRRLIDDTGDGPPDGLPT